MDFEKIGCDFVDWLVENKYLEFEEGVQEHQNIIDDLEKTYEIAPRLVNLIKNIVDR